MSDTISWIATAATIVAAFMTAANLGSRITGYGFGGFLVGSLSWIAVGTLTGQPPLLWTNIVLTLLNIFGVWRWLGRQSKVEQGAKAASKASEQTPGEPLFPVSLLSHASVEIAGDPIGSCIDAMAGCQSGKLSYVVVSQGGVAGMGETLRRLRWADAHVEDDRLVAELSADQFNKLEELSRNQWPAR